MFSSLSVILHLAVFQSQFVKVDVFDEVGSLKSRNIELGKIGRVGREHDGGGEIEFVAYGAHVLVEIVFVVLAVEHHNFVCGYFFVFKSFRPNFYHIYSIAQTNAKRKRQTIDFKRKFIYNVR